MTYGNWGFPSWSSGKWTDDKKEVDWNTPAIDEMDLAFKAHDYVYQYRKQKIPLADIQLIKRLKKINVDGVYKNSYKYAAILIFYIKYMFFT